MASKDWIDKFKWIMKIGVIPQALPGIARGWLNQFLTDAKADGKLNVPIIFSMVEKNESLWDMIDPKFIPEMHSLLAGTGKLDWFTVDWAIAAVRVKHPDIASLFMGDPDARAWFQVQLNTFRDSLLAPVS